MNALALLSVFMMALGFARGQSSCPSCPSGGGDCSAWTNSVCSSACLCGNCCSLHEKPSHFGPLGTMKLDEVVSGPAKISRDKIDALKKAAADMREEMKKYEAAQAAKNDGDSGSLRHR